MRASQEVAAPSHAHGSRHEETILPTTRGRPRSQPRRKTREREGRGNRTHRWENNIFPGSHLRGLPRRWGSP